MKGLYYRAAVSDAEAKLVIQETVSLCFHLLRQKKHCCFRPGNATDTRFNDTFFVNYFTTSHRYSQLDSHHGGAVESLFDRMLKEFPVSLSPGVNPCL